MSTSRRSTLDLFRDKQNERHSLEASINSMTDDQFEHMVATNAEIDDIRLALVSVPLREANIASARQSGRPCLTGKEVIGVLKTYTKQQLTELLYALDDSTFSALYSQQRVRDIINESPILSIRADALKTNDNRM